MKVAIGNDHHGIELKERIKDSENAKSEFIKRNINFPEKNITFYELLKRPEITIDLIKKLIDISKYNNVLENVEIEVKYEGYIAKAYKESQKLRKEEEKKIPSDIDYSKIKNLASEARQKLEEIRPNTISQASRISGVNPVDISILAIYLKKEYGKQND